MRILWGWARLLPLVVIPLFVVGCIPKEAGYDEMGRRIEKRKAVAIEPKGGRPPSPPAASPPPSAPTSGEGASPIEAKTAPPPPEVAKTSGQCAEHMLQLYSRLPEVQEALRAAKPQTIEDVTRIVNTELEKRFGTAALTCPITRKRYYVLDQKATEKEGFAGIIADAAPHPDGTRFAVSLKLGQDGKPVATVISFSEAKRLYAEAKYRMPNPGTPERKCLDTVEDIGRALAMHAEKHGNKVPTATDSLAASEKLLEFRPLYGTEFWVCPITKKPYSINQAVLNLGPEEFRKLPVNTVALVYDSVPHPDGSRCVLTNGAIARLREADWKKLRR